jgi:hypothetical protein
VVRQAVTVTLAEMGFVNLTVSGYINMNCRELQGYILDRVLGEDLTGSIEEKMEEHLSGCPSCRRRLQEAERAWGSLRVLETVRFPESLSRRVLETAAPRRRGFRLLLRPLNQGKLILAAASLVLAAGLLLLFIRSISSGSDTTLETLRSASTFSRSRLPAPDLYATLDEYLEESGVILSELENGVYPTWGVLLSELISRDIQGRSNFLLESPELNPRARTVVGALHQCFWTLLQTGRGREKEEVDLPPGVNPALLRNEIEHYRFETLGARR